MALGENIRAESRRSSAARRQPHSASVLVRTAPSIRRSCMSKRKCRRCCSIHGMSDTTVRVETADAFVEKLKEVGFEDITYVKIEGGNHGVAYEHSMERSMRAINEFLERTLKLTRNGTIVTSAPAN